MKVIAVKTTKREPYFL